MTPTGFRKAQPPNAILPAKTRIRRPLAQLLHALNEPLTGLQCAMEVALASSRTLEQYVLGLREGLELTARMRALVEAIREVTDGEEEKNENKNEEPETTGLKTVLREVLEGLQPVAEEEGSHRLRLWGSFPGGESGTAKAGHGGIPVRGIGAEPCQRGKRAAG